jgi:hypothetical protein
MTLSRRLPLRMSFAFGLFALLTACAGETSAPRPPSQAQQLCQSWGYAPNDPMCLNTFRSTGGQ